MGTQGTRVVVVDERGLVVAWASRSWALQEDSSDVREQDPEVWWNAIIACVHEALASIDSNKHVVAISVAATSGTLVLADEKMKPIRPAIMWNDKRARKESAVAAVVLDRPDMRPGFSLAKAMWVLRNEPAVWGQVRHVISAGDWLLARLTGGEPASDYTNAMKTGLDLDTLKWPTELRDLGIDTTLLPRVVAPGSFLGVVTPEIANATGLANTTRVIVGLTDSTAAQVAAGVVDEGQWVTTIGTGLSIKGVSAKRLDDKTGTLYSHRHWTQGWIPTGTSHCGADSLSLRFQGENLADLTEAAPHALSSTLVLPLTTVGEFFPFHAPDARGFEIGTPTNHADLFRGYLEGIAFVERLGMERMCSSGAEVVGPQVTMGGGSANDEWMRLRATILNRPTSRPAHTNSAFGAAIVAASTESDISSTARRMVKYVATFDPSSQRIEQYEGRYAEFIRALVNHGYLAGSQYA